MEEPVEVELNVNAPIAEESSRKKGKKDGKNSAKKKTSQGRTSKKQENPIAGDRESSPGAVENSKDESQGITVSLFDYSVENHFRAVDLISMLCGESEFDSFDEGEEIERLSSSITFLREWRHFNYQSRIIRFACQTESPHGKDVIGGINLPQFSAATVPMFIAVAAHPPESSYHKIGAPLTGRGVIQIWCLLNVSTKEENLFPQAKKRPKKNSRNGESVKFKVTQPKKAKGRPRKKPVNESVDNLGATQPKAKGRPRKKPVNESVDNLGCNNQFVPLAVQFPGDSNKLLPVEGFSGDTHEHITKEDTGSKRKRSSKGVAMDNSALTSSANKKLKGKARKKGQIGRNDLPLLTQKENAELSLMSPQMSSSCGQEPPGLSKSAANHGFSEIDPTAYPIPEDLALPRVVLCLAHNGKVAWDVKWRPSNVCDTESKHRMGYLAVLLGNGALEV
ncbi:unnamed protein product [Ilex paraguariensis]|uniref:Uncharacterized protein n=1 Tax=Ilex paraguariensis TaxID=185542 RepID=A0ABC8SUJ0_9AQUA